MYYVYILTNKSHHVLYIGMTGNLEGRLHDHRARRIEGFTKTYQCTKIIYYESYPDLRSAIAREKQLKGWRREKKIALIEKLNPRWVDLFEEVMAGYTLDMLPRAERSELIVRGSSTAACASAQDDKV